MVTHLQPNLLELEVHGSGNGAVIRPKVKQLLNIGQKVAWDIGMCTGNRIIIVRFRYRIDTDGVGRVGLPPSVDNPSF